MALLDADRIRKERSPIKAGIYLGLSLASGVLALVDGFLLLSLIKPQ